MGRITFVAWLFVMGAACVLGAIAEHSWGWLIGGIVFFVVANIARRQLKKEHEVGREPPRLGFVAWAMLAMIVCMGFLFWIQFSA